MATPEPGDRTAVWPMFVAVGMVVACCAGSALLALAATGIGVAAIRSGTALAGAATVAVLVVIGLVWWRRQACPCPAASAGPPSHAPRATDDDEAAPRKRLTHDP